MNSTLNPMRGVYGLERLGRATVRAVEEIGYLGALLIESLFWLIVGPFRRQPVRIAAVFQQMTQIGVNAVPIALVLAFGVGVMLAIQGIHTMKTFGAESKVVIGIALSVTREFSSLIVGILVAGRSGSAMAARIGTMVVNQEIDALRVIGINPIRYLVAPSLLALSIVLPALTVLADFAALFGGAVYTSMDVGISLAAYAQDTVEVLKVNDVMQGVNKAFVFAILIALIGAGNGFVATGGAEGVGRVTTRSVVMSISAIVMADMMFTFFLTR
ncbi:MAG: ABC transporter permease [Gammaproteobacteria bacterium]|nr:ABC transporter permease [Gammaproteobacteria bacterium]MCP5135517.1 ABC transporter permease [Gammaproteobacteria bacterium]